MTIEVWLAFVVAAAVLCIIPGPTVILFVALAVGGGRKSVLPLTAGVLSGDFAAMSFSLLGLGAVLATSAALFFVLKWIGAVYLLYLGVKVWRANPDSAEWRRGESSSKAGMFKSAFWVTVLNPKSIAFFIAFFPQFVNPEFGAARQLCILMITFLSIVAVNIVCYAAFAGAIRRKVQNSRVRKNMNKAAGGALIGSGVFAAAIQRSG
ncbi:MAG: LysE family translocator [Gammaproteobacteria bacterium]